MRPAPLRAPVAPVALVALAALAAAHLAAAPALAAEVTGCLRPEANAWNLARPYEGATREFSNGEVALLYILLDEPACCGASLMVLWPDPETGSSLCRFVTTGGGAGWSSLDLPGATASYDPRSGLAIAVPGSRWTGEDYERFTLGVTLNRAAGTVAAAEDPRPAR